MVYRTKGAAEDGPRIKLAALGLLTGLWDRLPMRSGYPIVVDHGRRIGVVVLGAAVIPIGGIAEQPCIRGRNWACK